MNDEILRLHHYILCTRTEGPGARAAIWVQGCPNHCVGCASPDTWSFAEGYEKRVDELADEILAVPHLEGVTFAGGEPFCQAQALASLGRRLQREGLSIITFSGYTLADLRDMHEDDVTGLLSVTDVLIDGPYMEELACQDRPLVGSSNQEYHFLTKRYAFLEEFWRGGKNKAEVRIMPDGRISVNGMLALNFMKGLL